MEVKRKVVRYNSSNKKDRLWRTNEKWYGTIVVIRRTGHGGQTKSGKVQ
jgi:hypothetical protein